MGGKKSDCRKPEITPGVMYRNMFKSLICNSVSAVTTCTHMIRWWPPTFLWGGRRRWAPRCSARCSNITTATGCWVTKSLQWVSNKSNCCQYKTVLTILLVFMTDDLFTADTKRNFYFFGRNMQINPKFILFRGKIKSKWKICKMYKLLIGRWIIFHLITGFLKEMRVKIKFNFNWILAIYNASLVIIMECK